MRQAGAIGVAGAAMTAPLFGLPSKKMAIPSSLDTSDSSILVVSTVIALDVLQALILTG